MARSRQEAIAAVGGAMQQYQRSVEAFDDAVGRALDLGVAERRCLDWLTDGPRSAGELAVATGLRPAATTAMIDRLSARGLVRRVASDTDRRKVLVEMTDAGRELTWRAYGPLVEEGQHLFRDLSVAQLDAMRDLLRDMRDLTDRHRARVQSGG